MSLLLTEPTLFYWNLLNDFISSDLKDAYISSVFDWRQHVPSEKTAPASLSANTRGRHVRVSSSHTTSSAVSHLTKKTTATTATPPPTTPTTSVVGDDLEIATGFLDEDNRSERMAAYALVGMKKPPNSRRQASGLCNTVMPVQVE